MIALRKFTVYVDDKELTFRAGDKIPAKVVKECGLENKPDMAKPTAVKSTKTE